jgi:hypothetical protein
MAPKAREFDAFKPYSDEILDRVWRGGLIVLDANVLLHLYRVDEKLRNALFGILEDRQIAARLWFPHQVVVEFFANRANVIASQLRALETLSKRVAEALRALPETKDTPRFLIDREKLKTILKETEDKVVGFLNEASASYPASISKDQILDRVSPIFAGRVGPAPNQSVRATTIEEGKRRTKEKIPPGFLDGDKPENGDYLVWSQCLEKCTQEKRDLLLVTDDKKEDWWHRVHAYTIGPRPELRAEFYASSTGSDFVLASFETFVDRISKYIGTTVSPSTVDDARQFALFHHRLEAFEDQDEPDWDEMRDRAVEQYRETAPTTNGEATTSVDNMVRWFFERYEDPANGVPYDGREGGYQYVAGGPYDAEEELREAFENGSKRVERMISEAARRIQGSGTEWIKRGEY